MDQSFLRIQRAATIKVLASVLVLIATASCAFTDLAQPSDLPTTTPLVFPTVTLPNSANAFDVNSLVGQPAPEFMLPSASGDSYAFRANDGRKHVIVFYMGYV